MKKPCVWISWMVLVLMAAGPGRVLALDEDACTNNAMPRTTPSTDFTVIGDGSVVRHEATGLDWRRCAIGQSWDGTTCSSLASLYTWQDALNEAAAADGDWRLPNINELRSIVEECRTDPAINRVVFPNTPSSYFWSASPSAGNSDNAWPVYFLNGNDLWLNKSYSSRVRLVRGGQ